VRTPATPRIAAPLPHSRCIVPHPRRVLSPPLQTGAVGAAQRGNAG